jgi:hypothetical protein
MSPQHYTKNTLGISRFCNTCRRTTMWSVSDGRLGRCQEDHHKPQKPKPEPSKQQDLIEPKKSSGHRS